MATTATDLMGRVATAIRDGTTPSAALATLQQEMAARHAELEDKRKLALEGALDVLSSADAAVRHRRGADDLLFELQRSEAASRELAKAFEAAQTDEQRRREGEEYTSAKEEAEALAKELRDLYPNFASRLASLMTKIQASNRRIAAANANRLAGAELIKRPEEAARGYDGVFGAGMSPVWSIAGKLCLPEFGLSGRTLWPGDRNNPNPGAAPFS